MQESKSYQRHFALCLADFYSVSLNSINSEICKCSEDPLGNKQRLHNKFSKELDYCVQVLCKIGQEAVRDKFKEMNSAKTKFQIFVNLYGLLTKICLSLQRKTIIRCSIIYT